MKTCPKCGELNGNNNTKCYKCSTPLGKIDGYKKYVLSAAFSIRQRQVDVRNVGASYLFFLGKF